MRDAHHRPVTYLRLSVTDRCNLRCLYCMPPEGIKKQPHDTILRNEDFLCIASVMAGLGVEKIRLTGGEPLVRRGLPELLHGLSHLPGIREVSLTTNGILLADQLDELQAAGLRRVNLSLDSLRPDTYRMLTRGGNLADALRGMERARAAGLTPLKVNVVLIRGVNTDEIPDFLELAETGVEVRFIELMPVGEAAGWSRERFEDLGQLVGSRSDLEPLPDHGNGGPCRYYRRRNRNGIIGIINPLSDHFCGTCNRVRVTSDGMLRTCLHSNGETDLKPWLGTGADKRQLEQTIVEAVLYKPAQHRLAGAMPEISTRNMHRIGG